jgi:hypothetical protein
MAKNDRVVEVTMRLTIRGTTEEGKPDTRVEVEDEDVEIVVGSAVGMISAEWARDEMMAGSDCFATCIKSEVVTVKPLSAA